MNVLRLISGSSAAALAYGLDKKGQGQLNVLIFDLGGGTLNVSILSIDDGITEVLSVLGDTHLGDEDFTKQIVNHFIEEFKNKHNKDLANDRRAVQRLYAASECAKHILSSSTQAR